MSRVSRYSPPAVVAAVPKMSLAVVLMIGICGLEGVLWDWMKWWEGGKCGGGSGGGEEREGEMDG